MDPRRTILVIGGGPAGTAAAIAAKKQEPGATVIQISEESCEPYEKPPLSKAVLLGKAHPADALIAGPGGVASHDVVLETQAQCTSIDAAGRAVVLAGGRRITYDALVLATGSLVRELPLLPLDMPRVHYLRNEADAHALNAALRRSETLLVVGAGLIGLEVAAAAAEIGIRTTVMELAPRILSRVCDEDTGGIIEIAHRRHGVDIRLGCAMVSAVPDPSGRITVVTAANEQLTVDLVVVGTGAKPNDRLAATAGLAIDEGIVVDDECRTSDPAILAAGDVVRFPGPHGPVRLENWRHAQDQGLVAGRNAAGAHESYRAVPSFWSEQYDLYIQGVGWSTPDITRIRRPEQNDGVLILDVSEGRLVHAMGINAQRDLAAARRLIERRVPIDPTALADPSQPLAGMLKR